MKASKSKSPSTSTKVGAAYVPTSPRLNGFVVGVEEEKLWLVSISLTPRFPGVPLKWLLGRNLT